jgi:hypothetical protein
MDLNLKINKFVFPFYVCHRHRMRFNYHVYLARIQPATATRISVENGSLSPLAAFTTMYCSEYHTEIITILKLF